MNKLALQYSVAVNTVRKTLAAMEKDGLLSRGGRIYHQVINRVLTASRAMVLIAAGDEAHQMRLGDWRIQHVAESFERECVRLNYESRCIGFQHDSADALLQVTMALKPIRDIGGYLVSMWHPGNETRWKRWMDLLSLLASRGKPVVIIDQDGALAFPSQLLNNRNIRVLRISGERAGEGVAAALIHRGDTNIVYISGYFHFEWVKKRYAGLSRYMRQFGPSRASVKLSVLDFDIREMALALSLLGFNERDTLRIFSERYVGEDQKVLQRDWQTARTIALAEPGGFEPLASTAQDFARYLLELISRKHNRTVYDALLSSLVTLLSDRGSDSYLDPLFKKALKAGTKATWVCSDDKAAIIALNFLHAAKIKVPEEVAVVGFDNWLSAAEHHISSFDLNMNGFVQQALILILDEKAFKAMPVISEVDGYMVERQTTRR